MSCTNASARCSPPRRTASSAGSWPTCLTCGDHRAALDWPTGVAGPAWAAWTVYRPPTSLPAPGARRPTTPSDRAGRFAALSLLILAMMIWLFTALLFAKHGVYHQMGPARVGPRWGG